MRTLPPSLRPPPSGAAVRGFAAVASCYDVKTTSPPSLSLEHAPRSSSLDPWPAVLLLAPRQSTCWCAHHPTTLLSCRERERAKTLYKILGNFPPKNIPQSLLKHKYSSCTADSPMCTHTFKHTDLLFEECHNIPGLWSVDKPLLQRGLCQIQCGPYCSRVLTLNHIK